MSRTRGTAEHGSHRLTREQVEKELAGTHYAVARRVAARIVHDDESASDVVHDVLLKFLEFPPLVIGSLRALFLTSVSHHALDVRRHHMNHTDGDGIDDERGLRSPESVEHAVETKSRISFGLASIRHLPPAERDGIRTHIRNQLTDEERTGSAGRPSRGHETNSVSIAAGRAQKKLRKWEEERKRHKRSH